MRVQHIQYFNLEYSVIGLPESVKLLKPTIFKEGNLWCASYTMDSYGLTVFGETPELAMIAFDQKYRDNRKRQGN